VINSDGEVLTAASGAGLAAGTGLLSELEAPPDSLGLAGAMALGVGIWWEKRSRDVVRGCPGPVYSRGYHDLVAPVKQDSYVGGRRCPHV
jgi:hypothetical protein